MPQIPVSAIVMTKDEEGNIERCLRSLERFDQVFVVDSDSQDRTVELAEALGATVVPFRWNRQYPKKKQWCLENLPFRHEWVIYVDADEEMTPEAADEIERTIANTSHSAFFVSYDYEFLRQVLRHGRRISKLVLMRHRDASYPQLDDLQSEYMWEVEGHYQPLIQGTVGRLRGRMVHREHPDLFHYFERHNKYSDWEAVVRANDAIVKSGEATVGLRPFMKIVFNRLPIRGLVAFLNSYVLRAGFLDGRAGYHYALSLGFYYWQIAVKQREKATTAA
ncbi:MAG TPA: glycosyltransferase family 2 protein [Solirubrobacteraceae bacterium]|nr:glycosyltransferase family 2 protein [Solirubrobacteraceae bacterium]